MRITCAHCGAKATVVSSRKLSARVTEATCQCSNNDCAARTVVRVVYDHTLTPPLSSCLNELHERLATMPVAEVRRLLEQYAG